MSGSFHNDAVTGLLDGELPACSRGKAVGKVGLEQKFGARGARRQTIGQRAAPRAASGQSSCPISAAMGQIRLLAVLVLLVGLQPGEGQAVLGRSAGEFFYSGKNVQYPLAIDFTVTAQPGVDGGVPDKPWVIEVQLNNARCGLPCFRVGLMLQEPGYGCCLSLTARRRPGSLKNWVQFLRQVISPGAARELAKRVQVRAHS